MVESIICGDAHWEFIIDQIDRLLELYVKWEKDKHVRMVILAVSYFIALISIFE
jgi:hypothetical protein